MEITELLSSLRTVLELGFPGIVLIMLYVVWRAYLLRTEQLIEILREVAGLRVNLARNEAALGNALRSDETTT